MQPWKISVGFTVIIIAIAGMIGGEHFAFVEPHLQILAVDYGMSLAWYGGAAIVSVMAQNQSSRHQPPSGGPDFQRPSNRAPATRVGVSKSLLLQGRGGVIFYKTSLL